MAEVQLQEVDTKALAAFLVRHCEAQHVNVTTVKQVRKATRYRASTVVTRKAVVPARPRHTTWTYDYNAGNMDSCDHRLDGGNFRSVRPGGKVRLTDLHK